MGSHGTGARANDREDTVLSLFPGAPPELASAIHVVPHERGSWRVQREGDDRPLSEHGSETAAERAAVAAGAPEVIVHDRYGRLHAVASRRRPDA